MNCGKYKNTSTTLKTQEGGDYIFTALYSQLNENYFVQTLLAILSSMQIEGKIKVLPESDYWM